MSARARTRTLVRHVVDALAVRAFVLTDHNPHGVALALVYKHGTAAHSLERRACTPSLQWLGLRHADVHASGAARLPDDAFQRFSDRDRAVLAGLRRRPAVARSADLMHELDSMEAMEVKVEIEALYCHGFAYLSGFLEQKVLHYDSDGCERHPGTPRGAVGQPDSERADQQELDGTQEAHSCWMAGEVEGAASDYASHESPPMSQHVALYMSPPAQKVQRVAHRVNETLDEDDWLLQSAPDEFSDW
jgi:hypothetical protein